MLWLSIMRNIRTCYRLTQLQVWAIAYRYLISILGNRELGGRFGTRLPMRRHLTPVHTTLPSYRTDRVEIRMRNNSKTKTHHTNLLLFHYLYLNALVVE